jgi:hypothetical protein
MAPVLMVQAAVCMLFLDVIVGVTIVSKIYVHSLPAKEGAG